MTTPPATPPGPEPEQPGPDRSAESGTPQAPQGSDKPADRSPEEPVQPPSSPIEPPASAIRAGNESGPQPQYPSPEQPQYPGSQPPPPYPSPGQPYPGPNQQYPPPPPLPPEAYPNYTGGQGYDYGGYGAPPVRRRNGMGVAALVLGIVAFLIPPTSILAVVFGRIGLNRVARGEATNRGVAQAGFILGIVTLVLWVLGLILLAGRH